MSTEENQECYTCVCEGVCEENNHDDESVSRLLCVVSFFIPIVGIILYCVRRRENTKEAKACAKSACISIILSTVISVILTICMFILPFKLAKDSYEYNTIAQTEQMTEYAEVPAIV